MTYHDVNMEEWEKRGILYGSSCKSVLFKNMPEAANRHFHFSHLNFIYDSIHNIKNNCRILDVGCGYGRITMPLTQILPEAEIIGMDTCYNFFLSPYVCPGKVIPWKNCRIFFRPLNLMDNILKKYRLPTLWLFYLIQGK